MYKHGGIEKYLLQTVDFNKQNRLPNRTLTVKYKGYPVHDYTEPKKKVQKELGSLVERNPNDV